MYLRKLLKAEFGRWTMAIGLLSVSAGLLLSRIGGLKPSVSGFSQGFCLGLGTVMLFASMVYTAHQRRKALTRRVE